MARNEDITLTPEQAKAVAHYESVFSALIGQSVSVAFVKRDGTPSILEGTVTELRGARSDHRVVCVDTDKGPRSANLWRVTEVN